MRMLLPACVALGIAFGGGCGGDAPEAPGPTAPAAREPAAAPAARQERPTTGKHIRDRMDELGRLRPAADRLYGFVVPVGMQLQYEARGAQVYDLVVPVDRLVEFWTHRDYAVSKEKRGWSVRHTSLTLVGQPSGVYDKARILVLIEGTNRARLRFWVPRGPENQLNPLNAEVLPTPAEEVAAEPPSPLPLGPTDTGRHVAARAGRPVRPEAPPAQWEPQPQLLQPTRPGRVDASNVVREWMRRNPGRTFQD